jgi:hypothetical protein
VRRFTLATKACLANEQHAAYRYFSFSQAFLTREKFAIYILSSLTQNCKVAHQGKTESSLFR